MMAGVNCLAARLSLSCLCASGELAGGAAASRAAGHDIGPLLQHGMCSSFADRCCSCQTGASRGDPTDLPQLSRLCAAKCRAAGHSTSLVLQLDGLCSVGQPAGGRGAAACRVAGVPTSLVLQLGDLCVAGSPAEGGAACNAAGLPSNLILQLCGLCPVDSPAEGAAAVILKTWSCSLVACVLQMRWQEQLLQSEKRWQGELQQAEQRLQQERDRTAAQQQEAARLQQDGAAMLQQIDELEVGLAGHQELPSVQLLLPWCHGC